MNSNVPGQLRGPPIVDDQIRYLGRETKECPAKSKVCIIVAGMHRSGTSAVTRVINLLGADIAADLLPAVVNENDRGFWEARAVFDIHNNLLRALDSSYDDPLPLPERWWETELAAAAKRHLADEIDKDFSSSSLFVVKDPRITRLMPLWLSLLSEMQIETVIVIPVRNPLEVVSSLRKREGVSTGQASLMYLRSYLEVELATRQCRRFFIRYDQLLADWRGFASKLEKVVGRSLLPPVPTAESEIEDFLSIDLYHHKSTREELETASNIARAVVELFDVMSAAADSTEQALQASFDRVHDVVAEATKLFAGVVVGERERHRLVADVPAMREELQRSSDALAEAGAYARHLEADLRARDAALAEADQASQATRVERDAAVAVGKAAQAERDAAVAVAETARAERDAAAAEAEAAWAEHDAAAAAVGESIKAAEAVRAERDAAAAALAEAGSYARHVEADLAATTAYARHVEADLAATTATLSQARSYARSLNAQLTAVRNSTSWRLSRPLRAIVNHWRTRRVLERRTPLPACVPVQDRSLAQTSVPAALTPPQSSPSSPIEAEHKARLTSNATANLEDFLASGDRINFVEASRSPDISVLIVLWNQAHLTLRCLRALHGETEPLWSPSLEVVLADNASSDETEELISRLDGVHVIRNSANVGYVRAANQAAEAARGRILLFLNSDAFVRPGALRAARDALESAPDIGVVGGRLILPSGLLQEAGSIVWSDASALGYGRGWAADIGEVMFRREVDYCSAAFLMTPRDLWQKLGGYDEVYSPSYYEETDYCERVWEAGFRVLYEPAVVVDHYEFGSEANPGEANAVFLVNQNRFRARHATGLHVAHLPFAPTNVLPARERRTQGRRRLLVFDNEVPLRALGSGYPRMREILVEAAKAGWSVSLFPLHLPIVDWNAVRPEIPWEVEILSGRGVSGIAKFLEERRGHYDVVLVSRPDNMALILPVLRERPHLMHGTRLVYDAEALFAARKIAEATFEGRPLPAGKADRMINDEVALAEAADAIICVNEVEAKEFRDRHAAPVHVLSHSTIPRFDAPGFDGRRGFLFVGRLLEQDTPNWRGLSWFIRKVWPLIRAELPEATIVVAGHLHPDASALEAAGVQLLGPVPNLSPLYDAARVFVAPINFSAGLPHKITEATEAGLPTAATRLMARQLAWTPGTEIAAEDEPSSLAAVALALHEKETVWTAMREAAQQRLLREHGAEDFRKRLYAVLDGRLSD
jgi:GT2 family glycosyltransferase